MKALRNGIYRASNVIFDANEISAYSYDWWKFVSVHKGFVVFNAYAYSATTQRHQSKVRSLMDSLGIRIDIEVETQDSLSSEAGRALIERILSDESPKAVNS